jgi:hypothetical protein
MTFPGSGIVDVTTRAAGEKVRAPLDDAVAHLRQLLVAVIS